MRTSPACVASTRRVAAAISQARRPEDRTPTQIHTIFSLIVGEWESTCQLAHDMRTNELRQELERASLAAVYALLPLLARTGRLNPFEDVL